LQFASYVAGTIIPRSRQAAILHLQWKKTIPLEDWHHQCPSVQVRIAPSYSLTDGTTNFCEAPRTYSPAQQIWAHSQTEVAGEDSKDSLRSPFTEMESKSSPAPIAELPAGFDAKELDATDVTPKPSQTELGFGVEKQASELGGTTPVELRTSTEKH
jgi:hypothetical protein